MVLSSLAQFDFVFFQDIRYAEMKMEKFEETVRNIQLDNDDRAKAVNKGAELALQEIERGIAKFFITGCMVNALQVSCQTTLVAIDWVVKGRRYDGGPDPQLLVSVVLCFVGILTDLPDIYDIYKVYRSARRILEHVPEESDIKREMRNAFRLASCLVIVYVFFMIWGALKLTALYVCD